MAETTVLRSSASPKNASPTSSAPAAELSGPLPIVNVVMGSGGRPQQQGGGKPVPRNVVILPPKNGAPAIAAPSAHAPSSPITSDQLLLCRHLVDQHRIASAADPDRVELATTTLAAIDAALAAANGVTKAPPPPAVVVTSARSTPGMTASAPRGVLRPQPPIAPAPAQDASSASPE